MGISSQCIKCIVAVQCLSFIPCSFYMYNITLADAVCTYIVFECVLYLFRETDHVYDQPDEVRMLPFVIVI